MMSSFGRGLIIWGLMLYIIGPPGEVYIAYQRRPFGTHRYEYINMNTINLITNLGTVDILQNLMDKGRIQLLSCC